MDSTVQLFAGGPLWLYSSESTQFSAARIDSSDEPTSSASSDEPASYGFLAERPLTMPSSFWSIPSPPVWVVENG